MLEDKKVELAKFLGLWLKYPKDDEEVLEDIQKLSYTKTSIVTFAFGEGDFNDDFEIEVETRENLQDAWEQAAEIVIDSLKSAVTMNLKLNKGN